VTGTLGGRSVFRALDDVSFAIGRGEHVALVGESGSGKSTLARLVVRLEPPSGGSLLLDGVDVLAAEPRPTLAFRRRVQMVFQDPFASLNPAHPIGHHLERPLRLHRPGEDVQALVRELLASVGLPEEMARRPARGLSGGQRQRVAIARALAPRPDLLVADEPTSMLDVSLRAGVLELLAREREERGLACLFITHDLASARAVASRLVVLYAGQVVETGPVEEILAAPAHPYTRLLVAAARPGDLRAPLPTRPGPAAASGSAGGPAQGRGCAFAARCPLAVRRCADEVPALHPAGPTRLARCHLLENT
jgi:oligopeptide/dipeptide ABC transporter ATP-binding protein